MRFGSLFSGIGGFDLGLERAGMECAWQVEIDPFCRKVLAKHWPDVPRFEDVRDVGAQNLAPVELIAGGFPCQPVSNAGRRRGPADPRWLWPEFERVLREMEPPFALVENVPGLLIRGMGDVLGGLAALGYDAEWGVLGASHVGATQDRERVWILANAHCSGLQGPVGLGEPPASGASWEAACSEPLRSDCGHWPPGPRSVTDIPRMADGPTDRVDRLKGLGNTVVPQVAYWIGRRLMEAL